MLNQRLLWRSAFCLKAKRASASEGNNNDLEDDKVRRKKKISGNIMRRNWYIFLGYCYLEV